MIDFLEKKALNKHNYFPSYSKTERDTAEINKVLFPSRISRTVEGVNTIQFRIELTPDADTKKLLRLRENICIALNDDSVRMFREGNELVIEKNGANNAVYLGDLYNKQFLEADGLNIMVGKDTAGRNIYTDLAKAPHILVAGTTGSGKSIFLHSAICSLLMKNSDIEIYIVDPKIQEYRIYSYLNNVTQVSTLKDAEITLTRLTQIMDARYNQYPSIEAANAAGEVWKPIVVVIDELADLMEQGGKKTIEPLLTRIAQKARACGIHLIVATQYPIVKYVTGALKANIPVKVALKTNSITESRVMLDQKGAETLRGNGDMLFRGKSNYTPIRVQGCFVTPIEIKNIVVLTKGEITTPNDDLYSAVFTPKKKPILQKLFGR